MRYYKEPATVTINGQVYEGVRFEIRADAHERRPVPSPLDFWKGFKVEATMEIDGSAFADFKQAIDAAVARQLEAERVVWRVLERFPFLDAPLEIRKLASVRRIGVEAAILIALRYGPNPARVRRRLRRAANLLRRAPRTSTLGEFVHATETASLALLPSWRS